MPTIAPLEYDRRLRDAVFEALNNAAHNGYDPLTTATVDEATRDLEDDFDLCVIAREDYGCEEGFTDEFRDETLRPHVTLWYERRRDGVLAPVPPFQRGDRVTWTDPSSEEVVQGVYGAPVISTTLIRSSVTMDGRVVMSGVDSRTLSRVVGAPPVAEEDAP